MAGEGSDPSPRRGGGPYDGRIDQVVVHARAGTLVVFAGAGMSMPPPTCLPGWNAVNEIVLGALADHLVVFTDEAFGADLRAKLVESRDTTSSFTPDYQAQLIEDECGLEYFRVLQALDTDARNRGHDAIASLAAGGLLALLVVVAAGALATSIADFALQLPNIRQNLPEILAPWQAWLDSIGLGQIDLVAQAEAALANLDDIAAALVEPLQQIAVASLSVVGTLLIVFFLSIYMVLDRDAVLAFLFRIVPPSYSEEARLLETSVSRSFGGFLRGQALMGFVYFLIALGTNLLLGLPLAALTSVAAGFLQMIPFFGPFISWAPPVIVALVLQPESALPALILMGAGWLVVMNVLQPRIMQGAVGIHPIVVLGSVLIGGRIAGIPGAIFGIPIAAVVSAFLLEFLHRTSADRTVAGRAARRLEERDGRPVRIPREPTPGSATDIDELELDEPDLEQADAQAEATEAADPDEPGSPTTTQP
jgi:predicted PurR-regulated permease PerM